MSPPAVLAVAGLSTHTPPVTWALLTSVEPDGWVVKSSDNKVAVPIEYVGVPVADAVKDPATVLVKSALAALVNTGAAPVTAKVRPA